MSKSCSMLSTSFFSSVILVFKYSSATAHLLAYRVWIPPGARMSISCEWCVLLGRGLCDGQIPPPEESYWQWCIRLCVILKPQQWNDLCLSGGSQIIKCNRTRAKFFHMSNPFFCSGKMPITMCLGIDKPSWQTVCGFAKFVNFNAK
jgi:hypothetical protein